MPTLQQLREIVAACPHLDAERIEQTFQKLLALDRQNRPAVEDIIAAVNPKPPSKKQLPTIEPGRSYSAMTTIQAVVAVLSEGTPLDSVALTMAIQDRGHRSHDDPRAVLKTVRAAINRHRARLERDADGRWRLPQMSSSP